MPVIIPPNHLQVTVNWASTMWASGGGSSTFGFRMDTAGTPSVMAASAVSRLRTALMPLTTDTVTMTDARWATATEGGLLIVNQVGGLTSTVSTPNVSMLLRKQTSARGPRGRGRTYWPQMVSETEVDEAGVIGGTRLTSINTALVNLVTGWDADLLTQVILQGDDGQSAPLNPPPEVDGFFCDPKVATQRRRMRR